MQEALFKPPGLTDEDLAKWNEITERRTLLEEIDKLLTRLNTGQAPNCARPAADQIANRLAESVAKIDKVVAEIAAEQAEINSADNNVAMAIDTGQQQEDAEFLELGKIIAALGSTCGDRDNLIRVLCGRLRISSADRERFIGLVTHIRQITDIRLAAQKPDEQRLRRLYDNHVISLAESPEKLLLLRRYQVAVERGIERKIRQLRGE
jgi:hypothetical protein